MDLRQKTVLEEAWRTRPLSEIEQRSTLPRCFPSDEARTRSGSTGCRLPPRSQNPPDPPPREGSLPKLPLLPPIRQGSLPEPPKVPAGSSSSSSSCSSSSATSSAIANPEPPASAPAPQPLPGTSAPSASASVPAPPPAKQPPVPPPKPTNRFSSPALLGKCFDVIVA
ncbi:phosphatase and actin regulator 4-like [Anguilla rostrata]|uniref:phosphatase and actin regulator 4-like n=1 Tax=Anguilla rostrata TaxID=7938 RepID=UPI0030CB44F5